MESDYLVEKQDGITPIRLRRSLDLVEIPKVIDSVARSHKCNRRLWDLTEHFDFTSEEIRKIATRGRDHWPTASRVAYVAADDLSFGLIRVFEVFREQENYQTRVFRDEQEARTWLLEWCG